MSSWVLVGTLPGGPGGVANVLARQNVGISQQTILDIRPEQEVGVDIELAPIRVTSSQVVGVSQDDLVTGEIQHSQSAGIALTSKVEGGGVGGQPVQGVGAEIKEVHITLTQTTYATSQQASGTWTNQAAAIGANNGTFATNANTLTAAASGQLVLSFAPQLNKTDLTISSVILNPFWKNVAGLVGPCTWRLEYSLDGGSNYTQLSTGTGSFDQTSAVGSWDLTAAVGGDWSKLTNLKVRFTYTGAASATPSTVSVDAVRLVVQASRVDTV